MAEIRIPVSKPSIGLKEKMNVAKAMSRGDIGIGPFIQEFEEKWAEKNGRKYGVSCNSGTNALYLALKAIGVGPGDEVIVPAFTMIATAWAVSYTGAKPVFIDASPFDYNLDPHLIDRLVTTKTKAIIPVHVYGRRCDMEKILAIAKRHGLKVIEDMAEAHGIKPTGDISCYSFYGNKIITTGEGGMCLTDNKGYAKEMRLLANMYFDKKRTMLHPKQGHNFRMTNLQAAVGVAQVERFDEIYERRMEIEALYDKALGLESRHETLWMYDIITPYFEQIKNALLERGIDSRYFFKSMTLQPQYKGAKRCVVAENLNGIYLPTYPELTKRQIKEIAEVVKAYLL